MGARVSVAPEMLLWAAERAGWDSADIEQHMPKLHEWVEGKTSPTLKQLQKFAKATHTPFGLLFLAEPPEENVPIPDMRTVRNADISRPSPDLLDTIYLCQSRQDWYRAYAQDNGIERLDFVGSVTTDTSPVQVASQIRSLLDFDIEQRAKFPTWENALRNLIDKIEEVGILVMVSSIVGGNTHRKLNPAEFRGFALSDPIAPLIFVNGADTKAAQIFTLIHEIGHIFLGRDALSNAAIGIKNDSEPIIGKFDELWCNQVAAEVLVPIATLLNEVKETTENMNLDQLARKFKVSTLVVLKRLYDAKFLTWGEYQQSYDTEFARVIELGKKNEAQSQGNYYNTLPRHISRQFAKSVIISALEGSTSYRDAYTLLGTKKHKTFENLAEHLGVR